MFGDIQTDLKDVAERTKRKQPRWKDPMEQFGGLVKDVESKARKAKASGWKDPSVMFDDIQGAIQWCVGLEIRGLIG